VRSIENQVRFIAEIPIFKCLIKPTLPVPQLELDRNNIINAVSGSVKNNEVWYATGRLDFMLESNLFLKIALQFLENATGQPR